VKNIALIMTAAVIIISAGCAKPKQPQGNLLSVEFPSDAPLRYKLTSDRNIELNFDPGGTLSKGKNAGQIQTITEKLDMLVAYKAIKTSETGTTVEATFENVAVARSSMTGKGNSGLDPVSSIKGKKIKFNVGPTGKIEDANEFKTLLDDVIKQAFGNKDSGIKSPEMTSDLIALVWFMWDPISSVPSPASGVSAGDTWNSQVLAPTPMPMNLARNAKYTFKGIDPNQAGAGVIDAEYTVSNERAPREWPFPYSGSFQMRGVFGFLRGYKVLGVEGKGEYKYSMALGRLEKMEQNYTAEIKTEMPFGLGTAGMTPKPNMIIKQKLSAQLVK